MISAFANPYIETICILTVRIRELNTKFIFKKSGVVLGTVLPFTFKQVKYAPLKT